jgi:N-acetylneuraminate synthase
MIDLYANISMGHENDFEVIQKRIIAAAQCNADAVIISKATPKLSIPKNKQYVSIESKWGHLPYIEVAKKSEIDDLNVRKINNLVNQIGIPLIWSVTDTEAAVWVKEHSSTSKIKIHYEGSRNKELVSFVCENWSEVILCNQDYDYTKEIIEKYFKPAVRQKDLNLYHTKTKFPCQIEELDLSNLDEMRKEFKHCNIGYEGRTTDIYPDCAVALKDVDFIEKYLGDDDTPEGPVLTPKRFYDFFINLNQLEVANG